MRDLRGAGCDVLTVGQYLAPSAVHLPVDRFVEPHELQHVPVRRQGSQRRAEDRRHGDAVRLRRRDRIAGVAPRRRWILPQGSYYVIPGLSLLV